ncbi:hypothetical protein ACQBJO_00345 [Janibacter sp. G349]|uniref:hypothetical protein n=1 Tax=Janibacter sp. G349 TaxID=3405424 RepID=UPI003B7DAB5A
MSAPPTAPRPSSGARGAVPYLLIGLGALLGCCGLGVVAYGGLGAVMVDQASEDPWVVWSLVLGLAASVIALVALVIGIVMLLRRPRG